MAQELSDKIRAAAIAKGVDPDLAVSIAQAESSLRPDVGAKTSSAKGLFGIIDKTWSAFGGKPGQQKDANENIRVGMDIIASNTGYLKKKLGRDPQPSEVYAAHFFGPSGAMAFLSADPNTPMESVFSQKVMDANPQLQGKTAQQIRGMLSKKVGGGSTAVASSAPAPSAAAQPKSGIQRAVYKAAPLTHPMLSQLGPNYQAAMAVSMLADEGEKEGKSEYEPSESERMLVEATARPVALAQADLSYQSPFPELQKQPVKMAAGGVPYVPTPTVRGSAKQELDKVKSQWDAYNTKAGSYNAELEKYTALVDAYNKGTRAEDFTGVEPVAPVQPTINADQYQAIADAAKKDIDRRSMALAVAANPEQFGLSMNKFFAEGGEVSGPDIGDAPAQETLARMFANKEFIPGVGDVTTAGMNKNFDVGGGNLNIAAALTSLSRDEKQQLAKNLMASYTRNIGDATVGVNVNKPVDIPADVYQAALMGSMPIGEGRAIISAQGTRVNGQSYPVNQMIGYEHPVGGGQLSFNASQVKDFPQSRQYQMQYRMPLGRAEGGAVEEDPQMMANKTTEPQGFTTRQPDGTGTLWGPDVPVSRSAKELKAYTEAMNPAVKTFTGGLGMGTRGYIYADEPDIINLNTALSPGEREVTMLHELEHSMDARGGDIYGRPNFAKMGGMDNNHRAYTLMGNRWDSVEDTVKNMVDNREKLEKFFGRPLDNSYFRKDSYDNLNKVGKTKAMFSEQLASLSALEQTTGKFLTQDPEMRELFPNYKMMAVYDALTGPRQTRMDARDLPPHTPVPSYTYVQNPVMRGLTKALTGTQEYGPSYRPLPIKRAGGSPETGEVGYFQDPFGVPDSGPVTADTLSKGKEFKAADALKAVKEVGTGVARNVKNIARGVTETPYNLVGAPADIGNMVLTPFGLGSAEPALGSAHLKRLALERGIRPAPPTDPRDAGFYMMGELGASLVNPGPIAARVGQATEKAVTAGGKAVAKEMLRGMEGKGVLAPISPQDSIMYAVKQRGGAFTGSRDMPEQYTYVQNPVQGQFVDDVTRLTRSGDLFPDTRYDLNISIQARKALNDWTESKIGSYIRRDMATEGDPFVKATDQGKKLHLHEGIDDIPSMDLEYRRRIAGMPKEGFAKTELGKKVEAQIDSSISPETLGDIDPSKMHPSLTGLRETDPNQPIYELGSRLSDRMQFPKLLEGMEDMLAQRNYKAYGEFSSPIPEQYHLTPEKLQGLSPVQASEKVALFNQWKEVERQKQAAQYLDKYGNTYKKYDNGRKWIAMDDLAEEPMQAELAKQAGCLGGWCTQNTDQAMINGSGDNRLHMLFDEKATPRIQLTVTKSTPTTDDFIASEFYSSEDVARFENKYGNLNYISREQIEATPEYQAWARTQDSSERITQLKGQFDKIKIADDPNTGKYLKEVQDFVKSKDWATVDNLDGINMVNLGEQIGGYHDTPILLDIMKKLNGNSVYADKSEAANILSKAQEIQNKQMNTFRPPSGPQRNNPFANGGMVERQPSTARYI